MSRYRVPTVVLDAGAQPLAGAAVLLRRADAAGEARVWVAAEGSDPLPAPLLTAADGGVPGWLAAGEYRAELVAGDGALLVGESFRVGPSGPPAPLPLCEGWSDYPGYAPSTFAGDSRTGIEVGGVIKAADEEGGCAGTTFALLPEGSRPARAVAVAAILGVVTEAGVEVRVDEVVALPDGRLRAPNQPCRWLSLLAPIHA